MVGTGRWVLGHRSQHRRLQWWRVDLLGVPVCRRRCRHPRRRTTPGALAGTLARSSSSRGWIARSHVIRLCLLAGAKKKQEAAQPADGRGAFESGCW